MKALERMRTFGREARANVTFVNGLSLDAVKSDYMLCKPDQKVVLF